MKKTTMKRIAASIAALCICSMAVAPMAASAADIKIQSTTTGISVKDRTFTAYQLFEVEEAASGFFAKVTSKTMKDYFAGILNKDLDADAQYAVDDDGNITVGSKDATDAFNTAVTDYINKLGKDNTIAVTKFAREALAAATAAGSDVPSKTSSYVAAEGTNPEYAYFKNELGLGYYVVAETTDNNGKTDYVISSVMLKNNNLDDNDDADDANDTVTISLKADQPTIQKKIWEDTDKDSTIDTGELFDSNTASIGEKVHYQLKSDVPDTYYYNQYVFKMTDTFSAGLDFQNNVAITIGGETVPTTEYKVTESGQTVTIEFNNIKKFIEASDKDAYAPGAEILVTYSALVTEDAEIGPTGNPNVVNLTYSNNPNQSGDYDTDGDGNPDNPDVPNQTTVTPDDIVITYLTELKIKKVGPDGTTALKGAKFSIKGTSISFVRTEKTVVVSKAEEFTDANGNDTYDAGEVYIDANDDGKWNDAVTKKVYEVEAVTEEVSQEATVKDDGTLTFSGIAAGNYTITETEAPTDYNKLENPITVTIDCEVPETVISKGDTCTWTPAATYDGKAYDNAAIDENGVITLTVVNKKGSTLPSTGGMGTKIFTVLGVSLMAGAAGAFAIKRKAMNK